MSSDNLCELLKGAKAQDFQSLAKLLTYLEREGPAVFAKAPELLTGTKMAFRLGITGPPGAGKSTLVSQIIKSARSQGQSVAVMAVDPSSPFSRGAVLGDRIRYSEHFSDTKVFIRSLGTRGSLGGLSGSAYLMLHAFDLAGFDLVIIETVGVGQTELEVVNVADFVSVVLVPESGDSIQGMKAGLLEIANLFIVNKFDRPGADSFKHELEMALQLAADHGDLPIVIGTNALTGEGVAEFLKAVSAKSGSPDWRSKRSSPQRLQSEARALLRENAEREISAKTSKITSLSDFAEMLKKS